MVSPVSRPRPAVTATSSLAPRRPSHTLLTLAVAFLALLASTPPAPVHAQTQPPEAVNNQDERVNLNATVDPHTERFTIFRSGDKGEINHYISEVIELQHADAFELLPHVLKAVRKEKGDARTLKYKDPKTGKVHYYMQIVTTKEQMPSVIATVKALDLTGVTSSTGDMYYHYRLKYRRASEVASIIRSTTLSGEGDIFADDITNTVFFRDSQSDGERDAVTIKFYDVPPPQVQFDVLAVEMEEDNTSRLGLDWDAWKRAVGGQFELTASRFEGGKSFARLDGLVTVDASALASFLNYTVDEGDAHVVTRTKITASNDRPGVVSSLRQVESDEYRTVSSLPWGPQVLSEETPGPGLPVSPAAGQNPAPGRTVAIVPPTTAYLQNRTDPLAPGAASIDPSTVQGPKGEGIYIVIQPTIGTDMVTADIHLVVNSLAGYTRLDQPILSERLLDTAVTLKNGEPFTLGGVDKETTLRDRTGIPGLKDLPLLKYLFSVQAQTRRRSKIFLVITPNFQNQVIFNSPVLLSSTPEKEPMVEVNTALPAPALPGSIAPVRK